MHAPLKYPIGIQTFSVIRKEGYVYVDKTRFIYELVSRGKYYFLSRPRRFGKSLLLSTIESYFKGEKALFQGLAIESLETDWKAYPVIMLSLAAYRPNDNNLLALLDNRLHELEQAYGVERRTTDPSERFRNIIRAAYEATGEEVVILIDEYDASIVANLDREDERENARDLLKSVYSTLKDMDRYIKFAMLTGVSRFGRMSVFSGLNNLKDISLLPAWGSICGITETELKSHLGRGVEQFANELNIDWEDALGLLKENYDGYHFSEKSEDIYNPFSLFNALSESRIAPYWFQTATPSFLVKYINHSHERFAGLFSETVSEYTLSDMESYQATPLGLLFQTGYLTIKDFDSRRRSYTLGVPNKEVEIGLFSELLAHNMRTEKYKLDKNLWDIRDALENGEAERALVLLRSMLKSVPGNVTAKRSEIFFENNLYLIFKLIGIDTRAEWWTADGRIDILLEMKNYVYVMELKLDKTPEEALAQINAKEYSLPWAADGRKVIKIGINFLSSTRNIASWIIEEE